ncbi:MAG TPA: hypothetical protein VFC79_06775, partial [Tissierellaceae bacterium]|nr:hypothetical protein [Tissierellaceae bacterium]
WRTDDRYEYDADRQVMTNISNVKNGLAMPKEMVVKKHELRPDFWELIEEKKPLFITEDGVEVFDKNTIVYNVRNNTLEKIKIHSIHLSKYDFEHKVFFHESNADEYIWRNKRLFSYNDIEKYQSGGDGVWYDVKAIAIGRSKE